MSGVGPHQQRVPVGRGASRKLGADRAARARARVADYGLTKAFAELLSEQASENIGLGSRRLGDDDAHRFGWVALGEN